MVYVEWRNDHLSNYVADSIVKKWHNADAAKDVNIYLFALNQNDLVPELQSKITRVPSLIYVGKKKEIEVLSTINKYEDDIIPFVNRVTKPYEGPRSSEILASESDDEEYLNKEQHEETIETIDPKLNAEVKKEDNEEQLQEVEKN